MIAVPSRPSAEWNRWVKKDPFLTYAPLGDPSCANMKQKPCGFREAPALRALAGVARGVDPCGMGACLLNLLNFGKNCKKEIAISKTYDIM